MFWTFCLVQGVQEKIIVFFLIYYVCHKGVFLQIANLGTSCMILFSRDSDLTTTNVSLLVIQIVKSIE